MAKWDADDEKQCAVINITQTEQECQTRCEQIRCVAGDRQTTPSHV